MAVYTNSQMEGDIVLSDVHICLPHTDSTNQGQDSQRRQTWLSRFYFQLPQNCSTAQKPLGIASTSANHRSSFGESCAPTVKLQRKRPHIFIESVYPRLDEDGDCLLVRRGSHKLFHHGSQKTIQSQVISNTSQETDSVIDVVFPVSETTHESDCTELKPNAVKIKTGNLLGVAKEDQTDAYSAEGILSDKEQLLGENAADASEKKFQDGGNREDLLTVKRPANDVCQTAFNIDIDNKGTKNLCCTSTCSADVSSPVRCVHVANSHDVSDDHSVVSVQEPLNGSSNKHTKKCNHHTNEHAKVERHESFLKMVNTLQKVMTSPCTSELNLHTKDSKSCFYKEKLLCNSSVSKDGFAQNENVLSDKEKLESVDNNLQTDFELDRGYSYLCELRSFDQVSIVSPKEDKLTYGVLTIEHSMGTSIADVGFQVWSGALLLCDYLLQNYAELENTTVLDLGTGTGITAIVAAMFARHVVATDYLPVIVRLVEGNWERNKDVLPVRSCDQICCKVLDWTKEWGYFDAVPPSKFALTAADLKLVEEATIILAAEAIYDEDLTDALFRTIYTLLMKPPSKSVLLAVERRVVFCIENKDVCSPAYEHFLENVQDLVTVDEGPVHFTARKVDNTIPQFFQYQRSKELELWKISSRAVS